MRPIPRFGASPFRRLSSVAASPRAVELSKGCPILDAGGAVEVRPIMKLTL